MTPPRPSAVEDLIPSNDRGSERCRSPERSNLSGREVAIGFLHEVASTELGYPVRVSYAYTYLRNAQRVFRYDNAPHHPEIITYPHHKHLGPQDRLAPTDQPSLNHRYWLKSRPGWANNLLPDQGTLDAF